MACKTGCLKTAVFMRFALLFLFTFVSFVPCYSLAPVQKALTVHEPDMYDAYVDVMNILKATEKGETGPITEENIRYSVARYFLENADFGMLMVFAVCIHAYENKDKGFHGFMAERGVKDHIRMAAQPRNDSEIDKAAVFYNAMKKILPPLVFETITKQKDTVKKSERFTMKIGSGTPKAAVITYFTEKGITECLRYLHAEVRAELLRFDYFALHGAYYDLVDALKRGSPQTEDGRQIRSMIDGIWRAFVWAAGMSEDEPQPRPKALVLPGFEEAFFIEEEMGRPKQAVSAQESYSLLDLVYDALVKAGEYCYMELRFVSRPHAREWLGAARKFRDRLNGGVMTQNDWLDELKAIYDLTARLPFWPDKPFCCSVIGLAIHRLEYHRELQYSLIARLWERMQSCCAFEETGESMIERASRVWTRILQTEQDIGKYPWDGAVTRLFTVLRLPFGAESLKGFPSDAEWVAITRGLSFLINKHNALKEKLTADAKGAQDDELYKLNTRIEQENIFIQSLEGMRSDLMVIRRFHECLSGLFYEGMRGFREAMFNIMAERKASEPGTSAWRAAQALRGMYSEVTSDAFEMKRGYPVKLSPYMPKKEGQRLLIKDTLIPHIQMLQKSVREFEAVKQAA